MLSLKKEIQELKDLLKTLGTRNFSGKKGLLIKNSSYQFLINVSMKLGSLIFTVIMARLLLPEKMGLYSLALSTIVFFSAFSDLGLSNALMTYIPKKLSEKNKKSAKGYFNFLLKLKLILMIIVSLILMSLSYFISHNYYNKPIFYALLVGGFYIFIVGILGFYDQLFKSLNNFKSSLIKEIFFQMLRLFLIPLSLIALLKFQISNEFLLLFIFSLLSLCYLFPFIYLYKKSKKEIDFLKSESSNLSKTEINNLFKFLMPLIITSLSGVFFGYIDMIMLGKYVESEFISYYSTAFSLVSSAIVIISFISAGIFPLLSSLKEKQLKTLWKKSLKYSIIIAIFVSFFTLIFSSQIIRVLYGIEYIKSTTVLKFYSILIIISPIISLYENYFISQKRTNILAKTLIITTLLNIAGNFFFIRYGVSHYGGAGGILGACIATIISRVFYLGGLIIKKKEKI